MILRAYKAEITLALIMIGVITLMAFLNDINRQIRLKELRIYLLDSNREENNIDHMGLVMKYQIQKKMYENRINQDEADLVEARVNAILTEAMRDRAVEMDRYRYISLPTLWAINLMRALIGKPPIVDPLDDTAHAYLEAAYYYERNSFYARALEVYERAIRKERSNRSLVASITLHQGYCQSILGNYREAKELYQRVIRDYGDLPVAVTAVILLRYIDGFRSELERVVKEEPDSIQKSDKLYKLIAYREAIQVIQKIEKTVPPAERARVQYIKGRCYEDLAQKEKAIDTYQGIVTENPASQYARLANRRIYITGTTATNGTTVKNLAVMNNKVIRDPVLDQMKTQEKKILKQDKKESDAQVRSILREEETLRPVINIAKLESREKAEEADRLVKEKEKRGETDLEDAIWKITTMEGNIFVGTVKAETDGQVTLDTMIGDVTIPKERIVKREKAR